MAKKIILIAVAVILLIITVEAVKLLQLKGSISKYANYWKRRQADPGDFTYVVLGDSAAQAIGASRPELGYVGLLAARIEQATGKTVRIVNLSVTGAKIDDIIQKQLPEAQKYQPDLLTIEIGANDVTHYDKTQFKSQYEQLGAALPRGTVVANMPYFGGRVRVNSQAVDANKFIDETAQRYGLRVVDLQTITRQRQSFRNYAADFFHPSDRGYKNWADAFWETVQPLII